MPIREYVCPTCRHTIEVLELERGGKVRPLPPMCTNCNEDMVVKPSAATAIWKGGRPS